MTVVTESDRSNEDHCSDIRGLCQQHRLSAERYSGSGALDYVGIDYLVGLTCGECRHTIRVRYSRFLDLALQGATIRCDACGRATSHGWENLDDVLAMVAQQVRAKRRSRVA